jgi:hypothetical protein
MHNMLMRAVINNCSLSFESQLLVCVLFCIYRFPIERFSQPLADLTNEKIVMRRTTEPVNVISWG